MGPRKCRREHKQYLKFLESPSRTTLVLNSPVPFINPAPVRVGEIEKASKWVSPQFKGNGKFELKSHGIKTRSRNKRESSQQFPSLPFSSRGRTLGRRRTLSLDCALHSNGENAVKDTSYNLNRRAYSDGETGNCHSSGICRSNLENEELGDGIPNNECLNSISIVNDEINIGNADCYKDKLKCNNYSNNQDKTKFSKHFTKIHQHEPKVFFLGNVLRNESPEKTKPKILVEDTPMHEYGLSVRQKQVLEASELNPNKKLFFQVL